MATSVPRAHRDAEVGLGERGGVVHAVAHHGDRRGPRPAARARRPPCRRAAPRRARRRVMPTSAATDSAVARVVAGEQHRLAARARGAGRSPPRLVGLTVSATRDGARARSPRRRASSTDGAGRPSIADVAGGRPTSSSSARRSSPTAPEPGPAREVGRRRQRARRSARARGDDRPGDRVLARRLERPPAMPEHVVRGSCPSTARTSTSAIAPVVTVPVLSSTIVSTRRVRSRISGP